MARKTPRKSGKPWTPSDPLKLDKAIRHDIPAGGIADKLERADGALFSQVNNTVHSAKPVSQKSFSRQKKG